MLYIFSSINKMYTYSLMGGIFMNENSMNNFLEEKEDKKYFNIVKGIGVAFIITLLGAVRTAFLTAAVAISATWACPKTGPASKHRPTRAYMMFFISFRLLFLFFHLLCCILV